MSEIRTSIEDVDSLRQPDVCAAVWEILQSVLCKSQRTRLSIHVSIKSTKNSQNTPRKSWFYVKVSTKTTIDKSQLEGKCRNPALYDILEYMQSLENESHLCIQNPCDLEGEGHHSVQQNLLLEGESLTVLHKLKLSKQIEVSTLHLRVHQSVLHMMKACTHIHSYMAQIRIFRPKVDMSFTMKVGEAVSHTVFRVENRKKLSQWLPSVVTDSAFYLQDRDMIAVSQSVTPCTSDPTLISAQVLTGQNEYRNVTIKLTPVALYIPVAESESSYIKLTFYGPGHLPLDVGMTCTLLDDIEWSKFGLKINRETEVKANKDLLPCHTSVALRSSRGGYDMEHFIIQVFILLQTTDTTDIAADYQQMNKNLQSVLKEHRHSVISVIQGPTDRLLQPVFNKAKNRALVIRSINSICKAVTDIVSMSSNEQFRTTALQCMKVTDTVELGVQMNQTLKDISRRKHPGVWTGHLEKIFPHSKVDRQHVHEVSTGSLQCHQGADIEGVAEVLVKDKTGAFLVEVESNVIEVNTPLKNKEDKPYGNYDNRIKDRNRNCDIINDQALKVWSANTTQNNSNSDDVEQNYKCSNKGLETRYVNPDRTPEILKITEDIEKVSPFHQLGEDSPDVGMAEAAPFHQLVENSQVNMEKVSQSHQLVRNNPNVGMKILSPFHQLVEDSQEVGMDMTPDISEITQGMKDVSPFQQLASEIKLGPSSPQVSEEDPCLPENRLQEVPHSQALSLRLPERFCLNNSDGLQPYAHPNALHNKDVMESCFDRLVPTCCNKETDKTEEVLNLQKIVRDKDSTALNIGSEVSWSAFELLNSEDFEPTFEVVSNFVDELVDMEKSEKFTTKFQHKLLQDSECNVKDLLPQSENILIDRQSKHVHEDVTQHIENATDKRTELAVEKETTGAKLESSDVKKKQPFVENVQALDDWFNEVLIEVEEWLN